MNENVLRIGFTDTHKQVIEFFTDILGQRYKLVLDNEDPDYLIFGDRNFGTDNRRFDDKNCIKIFYTGENQRPWDYNSHFSITFDHFDTARNYRLPLYVIYDWDNKRKGLRHWSDYDRMADSTDKTGFCSFVVRNGGCEFRNIFFHELSQYKQITSAGPLFNNTGFILEYGDKAMETKQNFLKDYKFNMCFENSSYPGYATEKLFEAYMGGTIPIYWGSTTIDADFNPKAFLNWHNYQDNKDFIDAIREIDSNPKLYEEMFYQPLVVNDRYFNLNNFHKWFSKNVYRGQLK